VSVTDWHTLVTREEQKHAYAARTSLRVHEHNMRSIVNLGDFRERYYYARVSMLR